MWSGMMQGKSFVDGKTMNPYKHLNQNRIHPTEKPFEIYKYLLSRFVPEGANVLDTHLGSGSQRIVCYEMNINFTGLEISEMYFNEEEKRFNNHISQCKLNINFT
ncbi:MAG: hypothetical protein CMP76_17155 [Flavobacterium sp.]|mgnify:CR=1 FL=1|uniref:DNA methyltransferase n=1 Tax=Flavobacterium sp. TaxID=239 RepID=UPI000C661F6A|nr:DNA methyltransferase [Flavobacterium sp.]MBF05007.1 hypothetical protein [Flavobacterium sp.]|tara:strand:+ start:2399 stop:2713 length:315 start_codon:yes stop_codon:yes gene_type:complete